MHVTAIIAAAGSGSRVGSAQPKQMLDIGGGTMLQHSVRAFHRHPRVTDIVLVVPADTTTLAGLFKDTDGPPLRVVRGGERRQDSVANAFDAVSPSSEVVLIHDAARPFVSAALIDKTIDAAFEHGAAIAALQSRDTVKRVAGGSSARPSRAKRSTWRRRRRASGARCWPRRSPPDAPASR